MEKNPHHLIMGELTDYLTGRPLADTHDERFRQKIARHLVEVCGYEKNQIESGRQITVKAGSKTGLLKWIFWFASEKKPQ